MTNDPTDMTQTAPVPFEALATPRSRVNSIRVERLFNTGNYTSVKYSIGVEVPEGASAREAVLEVRKILSFLVPRKGDDWAISRAKELLDKYASDPEGLTAEQKEGLEDARDMLANEALKKQLRQEALRRLDDLGGHSEERDAKKSWDDVDDEEALF